MSPVTSYTVSDIQRITSGWGTGDWSESIRQHHAAHPMPSLKRQATTFLCEQLNDSVDRGHFGRGFNWALLALSLAENEIITDPDFQDCFRPSRISEHLLAGLISLQWRIYRSLNLIQASPRIEERVRSWACYSELYKSTRSDEFKMLSRLRQYSQHSLHSLLVLADESFTNYLMADPNSTFASEFEKPPFKQTYSQLHKEDVASGASYSVEAYNRIYEISLRNFAPFDDNSPIPQEFKETMLSACRLRELLDLEASVFRLDYKCDRLGSRKFVILPPTDRFGMALRFGYMRHGFSEYGFLKNEQKDALSFREMCLEWLQKYGGDTVRFVESFGLERVRVEMPGAVAKAFGETILLLNGSFARSLSKYLRLAMKC